MKNFTVTIGIPAFNEERNIVRLLKQLLNQDCDGFVLSEIIVASDGSTDGTVKKVRDLKSKKVSIMNFLSRQGKAAVQNHILQKANADYLILIDADTAVVHKDFLKQLINPLVNGADLTAARVEEVRPRTSIEKIFQASMQWKKELFETVNNGDNVYTCHGRARGFSKRYYKSIHFSHSVGEDAYSYFFCKRNNFNYQHVPNAHVYYRLPSTFTDHLSQSRRYFASKEIFVKEFGEKYIKEQYMLPLNLTVSLYFKYSFKNTWILLYFPLVVAIKIFSIISRSNSNTWRVATSSKRMKGAV